MLCDGDSKAITSVNHLEVYDIPVKEEDCVNHIAKRIFNSLTTLKNSHKKTAQPHIDISQNEKNHQYVRNKSAQACIRHSGDKN